MATSEILAAYNVLGIQASANKAEVKDAFVRLCKLHHPDKVPAEQRIAAEARFKDIKAAYDAILRGQAGYNVPSPGSKANPKYARAYYRAHGMGMDFGERGPIRCGGPFGGFATEWDFYRAMFRTTRNNPFVLIATGLLAIPTVSLLVSLANGDTAWISQFRERGLHIFADESLRANGRDAVGVNPFAIRRLEDIKDSYIFKDEKYAHLRKSVADATSGAAAGGFPSDDAPAPAPA